MITTTDTEHAFYFRAPDAKNWQLVGVFATPDEAWRAAFAHRGSGDYWVTPVEPGGPVNTEMTAAADKNRKLRPTSAATPSLC